MVEHSAVNRRVVGSSPTRGACKVRKISILRTFLLLKIENGRRLCLALLAFAIAAALLSISAMPWKKFIADLILHKAVLNIVFYNR